MSKIDKSILALLAMLIGLGIVGRMDYEDATMQAPAEKQDAIKLACQSMSFNRSPAQPENLQRFTVNGIDDIDEKAVQTAFHCVAIDE